ncbi:MAG: STAS domain-containing protein [Motiliproteus sp.]|nr:STAS domain-containing protein [Motiliproteus sp.]
MSVQSNIASDGKTLNISIIGRFDYSVHKEFRNAYSDHTNSRIAFKVDLRKAEYMDSSALGMLLLLKEHADKCQGSVSLHNPQPTVRKVLEIANFDRFFPIS